LRMTFERYLKVIGIAGETPRGSSDDKSCGMALAQG
jgi:hypothetical protein